ncbi:uncharacterized protein LOC126668680 [Mercurialis annua]|uniref:uncharacterized protein LOC126668680 n=1 Tax=Mercurialis annua TaxID=3986 RepID=UPI002160FE68|nr:uncharacterized protein LOC126668680 [Mercurialis annua]
MKRCIHDGIPTGSALHHRLQLPPDCKWCGEQETVLHLLFLCPFTRHIWFQCPLNFRSTWGTHTSFAQHWKATISQLKEIGSSSQDISLYCFTLWHIWKTRNNLIFREEEPTIEDTIRYIITDANEFEQSQIKHHSVPRRNQTFQSPQSTANIIPSGFMKLNYDAAVDIQKKRGFVGIIAKDDHSIQREKISAQFRFIWDPGILKMLALREAMNWAISQHWKKVIFEGDALQVSNIINSRQCSNAALQGICEDIWYLQNSFITTSIQYIPRTQNSEAHNWVQAVKHGIL